MKKILIVFLMFFALSSFAIDSVNKNKNEQSEFELTKNEFELTNTADFVIVVCSVTIRNTETGETRKVYAYGYDRNSCASNAYGNAHKLVKQLNDE
ncbi:hypothetical protein CW731_13250 [Polaribacter sp. ALD11]|uniref:hypothetical protein n=1 Tax=Polaribacter sp. ALD11 TaxID=2058137 RepID=UPI000C314D90|nr:hypothetical protein [Polaribacter sp. ALD11]AUC86185.1 hypothetical protein CW731_13250 [Polaribacter sp. ALD11]